MKILIPITGFARSGGGRVLSEFASRWVEAGHSVDFLVNQTAAVPYFPTAAGIIAIDHRGREVAPDRLDPQAPTNGWLGLAGLYLGLRRLGRHYDVILANHSLTAWPVRWAGCGAAVKFYYIQAYEPEYYEHEVGFKSRILEWMSVKSYTFDLHQIVNAPLYIGYKNVQSTQWVPPGLDFSLFRPAEVAPLSASADRIVLGCIGRREPFKGTQYVLDAFEELARRDGRYHLRVAFGNLPPGYSHPRVSVVMPQGDEQLAAFYRSLDIMVAPGTVQLGAPHYPVMEAMACGVPVVTTGYMPADPDNAWIVPVGQVGPIVDAVAAIVADPAAVRAALARGALAIAPFDWQRVAASMLDKFEQAR